MLKLIEMKAKPKRLEELKLSELSKTPEERDVFLIGELNKDLDRVQSACTALCSGDFHFLVLTFSSILFGIVWQYLGAFSWVQLKEGCCSKISTEEPVWV